MISVLGLVDKGNDKWWWVDGPKVQSYFLSLYPITHKTLFAMKFFGNLRPH
jgi:hypothetical protein